MVEAQSFCQSLAVCRFPNPRCACDYDIRRCSHPDLEIMWQNLSTRKRVYKGYAKLDDLLVER